MTVLPDLVKIFTISGRTVLSIVVTAERRYGPCRLCVNNNNNNIVRQSD